MGAGAKRPDVVAKPRASKRHYPLSGLLFCGPCGRRMEGSFNNERNNYRCVYAAATQINHPRSLYLREDTWTDRSTDETGFTIYDGIGYTTVGANTTSYVRTGLSPSTCMCFSVKAINNDGESRPTSYACTTTPPLPRGALESGSEPA